MRWRKRKHYRLFKNRRKPYKGYWIFRRKKW